MHIKSLTPAILTIEMIKNLSTKRGRMANRVIRNHRARNKDNFKLENINLRKLSDGSLAILLKNDIYLSSDPKSAILHIFNKNNEHIVRSYRNIITENGKLFTKATGHYNKFHKEIKASIQEKFLKLIDNKGYKKEESSMRMFINDRIFDTVVTFKDRVSEFPQTTIGKEIKNRTLQDDKFGYTFYTQITMRD